MKISEITDLVEKSSTVCPSGNCWPLRRLLWHELLHHSYGTCVWNRLVEMTGVAAIVAAIFVIVDFAV